MAPLQGMANDEIIEVAARAEKKRQRTIGAARRPASSLFLVGLLGFGVYITVQLNRLEAAQLGGDP